MENLTNEEISALEATTSGDEWNAQCDKIKAAHGGAYPADWWAVMKMIEKDAIFASWDKPESTDLKVETF